MNTNPADIASLRDTVIEKEFHRMNDRQRQAVFQTEGPVLILAGAGSGKTTVLVNRIAYMVKYGSAYHSAAVPTLSDDQLNRLRDAASGTAELPDELAAALAVDPCPSWKILAITFTNKAAQELKERLSRMLGEDGNEVMASTFHSFCARILRREGADIGYSSHFVIYDTDDSRRLMKDCMKQLNVDEKMLPAKTILSEIGRAKDRLLSPDGYAKEAGVDHRLKQMASCYGMYQRRLKEADAMDFDDLLNKTVELFQTCPDVLERYQRRYRYVMVDEYQDTNHAQYQLISLLAAGSGNLCVVGDDDQSIYKFRGATIENILNFEDEFPRCMTVRLEQNYRSTQNILNAANAVIAQNQQRKGKKLWTENGDGKKLQLYVLDNENEEGKQIGDTIVEGVAAGRNYRDFAVLYRANAQSNAIEKAFVKAGIPYRIFGGHRFYDTLEVKDAMAYLRVLNNPGDSVSLRRIVNQPKRGIGDTTMEHAARLADEQGTTLYEVISHADEYADLSRAASKLRQFTGMMEELRALSQDGETELHDLYQTMLDKTGYLTMWEAQGEAEVGRVDNLKELASSIRDFEENSESEYPDLSGFLEEAALMTDVDNYDTSADSVVMMTMHAAKGLEFPVVFLPGFEDGIFPGMASIYNPDDMEEERRICYVALTRAKEELYISRARSRMLYGQTTRNRISRFLNDVPPELFEEHEVSSEGYGYGYGGSIDGNAVSRWNKPQSGYSAGSGRADVPRWTPRPASAAPSYKAAPKAKPAGDVFTQSPAPTGDKWQAGDRVQHKAFGDGEILETRPMGNDMMLTIRFSKVGQKKIMANYAKLTRKDDTNSGD